MIADPEQQIPDENRANNRLEKQITVNKFVKRSCKEPLEKAAWDVTYNIISGYHTKKVTDHWYETDENGNKTRRSRTRTVTDYSNPIWKPVTVTYHESLSAKVTVNTKQGIPTDPKNPKEGDRESRGSWEIIPYAEKLSQELGYQVDPNEITRAGYGFELTVETDYQNDWESKVPSGSENTARPLGGTFNGPTRVVAEFYDPTYRPIKEIALERMPGSAAGKGKAVWMLPTLPRYTLQNGKDIYERKYYTSPDDKDGDYTIQVRVEYAGKNGLYICKQKVMKIWGSMYDDFYTAPMPLNLRDR